MKVIPSDSRLKIEASLDLGEDSWTELASRTGFGPWITNQGVTIDVDGSGVEVDQITLQTTEPIRGFRRFTIEAIPTP